MTHRPNAQPTTAHLIVTEYEFHKFVFCPALNKGLRYGKGENVNFERLKADLLHSAEILKTIRGIAHALADYYESLPNDHHK